MTTIVLWVSDLNKSVAFYSDLFEASNPYLSEEFASVSGLGNEVLLHLLPEQYRSEPSIGEENPIKPVFKIQSIDKARAIATKHNCSFKAEIMQHGSRTYVDGVDPDGHVIQVMTENQLGITAALVWVTLVYPGLAPTT